MKLRLSKTIIFASILIFRFDFVSTTFSFSISLFETSRFFTNEFCFEWSFNSFFSFSFSFNDASKSLLMSFSNKRVLMKYDVVRFEYISTNWFWNSIRSQNLLYRLICQTRVYCNKFKSIEFVVWNTINRAFAINCTKTFDWCQLIWQKFSLKK